MKLCSKCNKNIAVIFTSSIENGKKELKGYCLECAQKMGFTIMDELIKQTGMSTEDIENITKQMGNMLGDINLDDLDADESLLGMMNGMFSPEPKDEDFELDEDKEIREDAHFEDMELESNEKTKKKRKKRKYLDKYGSNLTDKARENRVDRVIGRNVEIERVIQILNRRNKNNPVLIGEPGVGKTAIAEGLAVRIIEGEVPAKLLDCEIYLLDLTAIVAGTQFRGQFEGRMKAIIDEATESGNVILVIDELHNIVGAGEVQGGVMNAANILKPALARGDIQVIGATTIEEYRKHIEKDSALERRFQPVMVDEPSIEETIEILKGIRDYYEDYHKVKIPDDSIVAAAKMSERYITDRFLPDKAIDVIDEAGSMVNLKNQCAFEIEALKRELESIQEQKEEAALKDDYEAAANFKMKEIEVQEKIKNFGAESSCEITVEDVAHVIESWTKIPVKKITREESQKLIELEATLRKKVIGQDKAVSLIAKSIRRNRSGFKKKRKPSSFIFVGPTGVGKTELARVLSTELFGSEEAMIRIDMSEYMEKHTVSKLIGAPPGYVGYDQGGQLTEKVRRRPYSVILLDEIEKAHADVFNMLLQILDDGRLTDSQGRTVFFENTVIIMTSNAGTDTKSAGIGFGHTGYDALEEKVNNALKETFRPEFLNRVDETVVFRPLGKEELVQIVELMLAEVSEEAVEKDIKIEVSQRMKSFLIEKGFDEKYGARPLRRTIQRYIEDEIAERYIRGIINEGSSVFVDIEGDEIVVSVL
ncbi:ATP-dependent Clp protease ATP-binding subunit ClpA [Peptoclostridium litorale DSM 5388]|uniref:Chaperone protein ClpB n=1 Tax=Peptoclostridium litorale DSM 5388 TaxID=1121324 RepID=A0A069RIV9_PEPLI|nr:ATP-dependent Clp protease ATP-binding subunit [Peptoclostridium litorale]KDR96733.1 chaperone protein ClpB [Peptoclostridium litorale DSM 5388]SIN67333.1 ATP-dependent Clp protease ATP-binding subunit ClpA [Peptoclostridium litorale DSM 5388]